MTTTIKWSSSPEANGAAEPQTVNSLDEAIMLGLEKMGITPPVQELQDDQSFRDDVLGYHFLHLGHHSELASEALKPRADLLPAAESWSESFGDELEGIVGADKIKNWEIGRIAVGTETDVDRSLLAYVGELETSEAEGGDEADDVSGQKLLYPKAGVTLKYLNRSTINLYEENPTEWTEEHGVSRDALAGLAFHTDTFSMARKIKRGAQVAVYNALSYSDGYSTHLKTIEEVLDISSRMKFTLW